MRATFPTEKALKHALHRYLKEPQISLAQYYRNRHLSIAIRTFNKTIIYLDQKWWIHCREAMEGKEAKPEHQVIMKELASLVHSGRVVCPITLCTLNETAKIGDLLVRRSTARTIDELSRCIALRPTIERIRLEFCNLWFSEMRDGIDPWPPARLVWTCPGFLAGEHWPTSDSLPPMVQTAAQKLVLDGVVNMNFSQALDLIVGEETSTYPKLETMANEFNSHRAKNERTRKSFEMIFAEEMDSLLDSLFSTGMINSQKSVELYAEHFSIDKREFDRFVADVRNNCRSRKWSTQFPFVHIFANLNAVSRRANLHYKANDLWDHDHACGALPYCDAFFTEKKMGSLITQKPIQLDRAYDCKVLWREKDVIEYLATL